MRVADYEVERGGASLLHPPGPGESWAWVQHRESQLEDFSDEHDSTVRNMREAVRRLAVRVREAGYRCQNCLGMGSVRGRVRLEAGHRCVRCGHPYVPKHDALMLGVESSWTDGCEGWTPCDTDCRHEGEGLSLRFRLPGEEEWASGEGLRVQTDEGPEERYAWAGRIIEDGFEVQARWRILTVHHADGDKANLAWWNLLALCQRCHLEIQAKVVMERVYPHEHSDWFKPYVAAYYAKVYLGEDIARPEAEARLDELLALERTPG